MEKYKVAIESTSYKNFNKGYSNTKEYYFFTTCIDEIEDVLIKLEEEGKPYSRELVSMNLLNLVRKMTLRRIKRENKWHYIVRN